MVKFTLFSMVADSTLYGFLWYAWLEADYRQTKNLKTAINGGEKKQLTRKDDVRKGRSDATKFKF